MALISCPCSLYIMIHSMFLFVLSSGDGCLSIQWVGFIYDLVGNIYTVIARKLVYLLYNQGLALHSLGCSCTKTQRAWTCCSKNSCVKRTHEQTNKHIFIGLSFPCCRQLVRDTINCSACRFLSVMMPSFSSSPQVAKMEFSSSVQLRLAIHIHFVTVIFNLM